jgi:hypothetical protein
MDNIVYQLCGGDISKKEYIEENFTLEDASMWFNLRMYENYVERKQME